MKEFQTSKNGYNKEEVNAYVLGIEKELAGCRNQITMLNKELVGYRMREKEMKEKENNISVALTTAVERAKQIEKSSSNVYKLKLQELQILYARYERILNEIVEKYPALDEKDNVKRLMVDFKNAIKNSIKEDFRFTATAVNTTSTDPMRQLLLKMNSGLDKQLSNGVDSRVAQRPRKPIPKDMQTKQSELNRLEEKTTMIKPIYDAKLKDGEKYESLVDKFLTEDASVDSAYASKLTAKVGAMPDVNESGFDLKEAVNPKEDLEEIMKSFDFFEQNG